MMKALDELREMCCDELDKMTQKAKERGGQMSPGDLETYHKLTDTIKNVDKIAMLEEGGYSQDDGYSGGGWEARGDYSRTYRGNNNSYRGTSYAGRHRDSMGRYSRADSTEHLRHQLRTMMQDDALADHQRAAIRKAMETMEA